MSTRRDPLLPLYLEEVKTEEVHAPIHLILNAFEESTDSTLNFSPRPGEYVVILRSPDRQGHC